MKNKLPLLLALAALGLAACGGEGASSSIPSSSDATSSEASGSETSSSESSSSSSPSSSSSSSEEPVPGWTAEELAIIESVVEDHELPYHDFKADGYSYLLEVQTDSTGGKLVSLQIEDFPFAGIADVVKTWAAGGFIDETSSYYDIPEGMTIMTKQYDDGSVLQAQIYLTELVDGEHYYSTDERGFFWLDVYPSALAMDSWTETLASLNALLLSTFGLDPIELPEPATAADSYLVQTVYDSYYNEYAQLRMNGINDESYIDQLKTAGWKELDGLGGNGHYLASPDDAVGVVTTLSGGNFYLEFMANSYFTSWPTERIATDVSYVGPVGSTTVPTLPVPSFMDQVSYIQISDAYAFYGMFSIYLFGGNFVDEYVAQLLAAGFEDVYYNVSENTHGYSNAERDILVVIGYDAYYNSTDLTVQGVEADYVKTWPAADIAEAVRTLGATDAPVVPAPTFDWDYGTIYDYLETDGYYEIDLKTLAEDGVSLVDTTEQYAAQLNASGSGWTYDSVQERWYNSLENISVNIAFVEGYGLCIVVQSYNPIHTSWPTAEIAALATETNVNTSVTSILPLETGSGYQVASGYAEVGTPTYFTVTVFGITAEEFAAYETALAAAGWETSTYSGGTKVWYDAAGTIVLMLIYDETEGYVMMNFYSVEDSVWGTWETNLANVITYWKTQDSSFVLPTPTLPEGTLLYLDYYFYFYGSIDMYILDLTVADGYASQLETAGWVENAELATLVGVEYAYTLTGSTSWTLYINVDEVNNVTQISISSAQG